MLKVFNPFINHSMRGYGERCLGFLLLWRLLYLNKVNPVFICVCVCACVCSAGNIFMFKSNSDIRNTMYQGPDELSKTLGNMDTFLSVVPEVKADLSSGYGWENARLWQVLELCILWYTALELPTNIIKTVSNMLDVCLTKNSKFTPSKIFLKVSCSHFRSLLTCWCGPKRLFCMLQLRSDWKSGFWCEMQTRHLS